MRKSFYVVLIILLLLPLVLARSNYTSAHISAVLQSQDPDPVEPGQVVTVKFKIENAGEQTAEDVVVKLVPKYPFELYGDVAEKNIGKLQADSTGADAVVVEYKLKVDEKAVENATEIELELLMGEEGGISYTDNEFTINIQTHDAVLDIVSIAYEPKQIAPSETARVSILVKNQADSLLKDIKFKLDFSDEDLPLAPYQSSSERRIPQLATGYQNSMTFNLIAKPDATPGLYKVPLNITYKDEKGNTYSVSDILAVIIGETPKVNAYIKKSSVLQSKEGGKVTIEVANAGTSDVKFVELYLLPSEDYQLITTSSYFYLGDIDSDDTESEEIEIYINKRNDVLKVPIQLKYYDANNKPFQQNFDLEMNLYSSWELNKFGIVKYNYTGAVIVLLILAAGGGYFYYREFYKKKKKLLSAIIK